MHINSWIFKSWKMLPNVTDEETEIQGDNYLHQAQLYDGDWGRWQANGRNVGRVFFSYYFFSLFV